MKVQAYAALNSGSPLQPYQIERRPPGAKDVQIQIDYCGICHTDIHFARNDWGITQYPCVPGHEIVGRVTAVGKDVSRYTVGDVVGVGCFVQSCRTCGSCKAGEENYCDRGVLYTYSGVEPDGSITYGGYSGGMVVDEHFVFRIPGTLDPAAAAPLLCVGITTYSPLRLIQLSRGDTIAVMGLGGLGHMAVQFAAAMGAEVSVLSRSEEKAADAKKLGAHDFINTRNPGALEKHAGRFRYIIDTIAVEHDITAPLSTLQRDGTLVMLGISAAPLSLGVFPLVFARRRLMGSLVGGVPQTQEMLDFCGAHGIACQIEKIGPGEINQAFERTLRGDVKYRFVIDCGQLHLNT